jgi:hypothetical protein
MATATSPSPLSSLPLWRLLVLLDDSERIDGPNAPATRMLGRLVRERLKARRNATVDEALADERKGAARVG